MTLNKLIGTAIIAPYADKFLVTTRKRDPGMWSIPGGKVDFGEVPIEAAVREMLEETNIDISNRLLYEVSCLTCYGPNTYTVYTYAIDPLTLDDLQVMEAEPGCYLDFLTKEELCSQYMTPFWKHNIEMFKNYIPESMSTKR